MAQATTQSGDDDATLSGDDDASLSGDDDASLSGDDDASLSGDDDATLSENDACSPRPVDGDDDATEIADISPLPPGYITTWASGSNYRYAYDGVPAIEAPVGAGQLVEAPDGTLYYTDFNHNVVHKQTSDGLIRTIVGTEANLSYPTGLALDSDGVLYFSDSDNGDVLSIDQNGILSTVYEAYGYPTGLLLDGHGSLYVSELYRAAIVKFDLKTGKSTRVAGTGSSFCEDTNGTALETSLGQPGGLALDQKGNLLVADAACNRIWKIDPSGHMELAAGDGEAGFAGDGGPATLAELDSPTAIAYDARGNLLVADWLNNRLRQIDPQGIITTVAGDGTTGSYCRQGGPLEIGLSPCSVTVGAKGQVYVSDSANYRFLELQGAQVTTIAGNGELYDIGDGGPAVDASLDPMSMVVDSHENLFVIDYANQRIRMVAPNGIITTVAGTANAPLEFAYPTGILFDPDDNLLFSTRNQIRLRTPDGLISTIAGTGDAGFSGDGGPATEADLSQNGQMVMAPDGTLYFCDSGNYIVRKIDSSGIISTVAGVPQQAGRSGDGLPATESTMNPSGIALDPAGRLIVAESVGSVIRRVEADGTLHTIAGTGTFGFSGDGGPATQAQISFLGELIFDSTGNLYFADNQNARVRMIDPAGIIHTVAGNGGLEPAFGDEGPALEANIAYPNNLAFGPDGSLFVSQNSIAIRRIYGPLPAP